MQKGIQQQNIPVKMNRQKHQINVTPPGTFFMRLFVYLLQTGHISPVPGTAGLGTNPWLLL